MIKLQFVRPNTVGTTWENTFDSYSECEELIERRCERLADRGWAIEELKGSDSRNGTIEATHDDHADSFLIRWRTPTMKCFECGCDFDLGTKCCAEEES